VVFHRGTFAQRGADGTEDVGGSGALIGGRGWAGSTPGPATRDRVLLTDPGFVGEPDLYLGRLDILVLGDFCQNSGESFMEWPTAYADPGAGSIADAVTAGTKPCHCGRSPPEDREDAGNQS
jgi:hypothetical protein